MTRALALAAVLLPSLAFAQEAKKFNAKDLEKDFAQVGVFTAKGAAVVDNEVMMAKEGDRDFVQAVFVVKFDIKKVIEFYKDKMKMEPKKEGEEELGTHKYIFAPLPAHKDKRLYKVTIEPSDKKGQVVITLMHRAVTEEDPVAESTD
ncbi:MAG TPA: hypothetical protein VGK67_36105 [Myxococcales bacterium]|jgi:hypothetical protein